MLLDAEPNHDIQEIDLPELLEYVLKEAMQQFTISFSSFPTTPHDLHQNFLAWIEDMTSQLIQDEALAGHKFLAKCHDEGMQRTWRVPQVSIDIVPLVAGIAKNHGVMVVQLHDKGANVER